MPLSADLAQLNCTKSGFLRHDEGTEVLHGEGCAIKAEMAGGGGSSCCMGQGVRVKGCADL